MLVLDTDHLSCLEWLGSADCRRLQSRLQQSDEDHVTTIVTYEEQSRGWLAYIARAKSLPEQLDAYGRLFRHLQLYLGMTVLEFDKSSAQQYQRLRSDRIHIGPMDQKIAAITLANNATLLSRNLKDFQKVPGLRVENWLD